MYFAVVDTGDFISFDIFAIDVDSINVVILGDFNIAFQEDVFNIIAYCPGSAFESVLVVAVICVRRVNSAWKIVIHLGIKQDVNGMKIVVRGIIHSES